MQIYDIAVPHRRSAVSESPEKKPGAPFLHERFARPHKAAERAPLDQADADLYVGDMGVKLNKPTYTHAMELINRGWSVADERDAWSEHQPTTAQENEFIQMYGCSEYSKWHLGIDDEQPQNSKRRYKLPYGDFKKVHRCTVLSAESRAGQYKHFDVERAAAHLYGMLDKGKYRKAA